MIDPKKTYVSPFVGLARKPLYAAESLDGMAAKGARVVLPLAAEVAIGETIEIAWPAIVERAPTEKVSLPKLREGMDAVPALKPKRGRPPADKPWEAEGISRMTWYRRAKAGAVSKRTLGRRKNKSG